MASTISQKQSAFTRVMHVVARKPHEPTKRSTRVSLGKASKERDVKQQWAAAAAPNSF